MLGNVDQFSTILGLSPKSQILAYMPVFHHFGRTTRGKPRIFASALWAGKNPASCFAT
jgi:hypothetical protein